MTSQVIKPADQFPSYRQTMVEKILSLRASGTGGGRIVDRITSTIAGVGKELSAPGNAANPLAQQPSATQTGRQPIPVTI